jgi:hypothetical protein
MKLRDDLSQIEKQVLCFKVMGAKIGMSLH